MDLVFCGLLLLGIVARTRMGQSQYRSLDLFCGAGGSSLGASLAGFQPVGGIDLWDTATESYKMNFPNARTFQTRLEEMSPKAVQQDIGNIDLLLASPECTNHSIAKGNAPRCELSKDTAFQVIRFAKHFSPRWIIVENVANMRRWRRFSEWEEALKELGYNIESRILSADSFGVPQSRRRLFMVCDREMQPTIPVGNRKKYKTARDILMDTSSIDSPWSYTPLYRKGRARDTLLRARRAMYHLGDSADFLLVYYGTDMVGGWQPLDRPLRTITTLDRFALVRKEGRSRSMRMLQPEELAAAMGFPASYQFPDTTRRSKVKLMGNAVCPPVMETLAASLLKSA